MFTIDYCGYNTRNPDCDIIYRPGGSASYLFLLIMSPMNFEIDKEIVQAKKGACILYTPGFPQRYQAVKEFYNSYVHFYVEEEQLSQFSFPKNKIFYPENMDDINWYIKKIHQEYFIKKPHFEEQIHSLILQLIVDVDREYMHSYHEDNVNSSLYLAFQSLRLQMLSYCEEEWPIERLCKLVNMEKSQFYSYYQKFFHNSPKAELLNARLDKAKFLLTNEALQISQVAKESGFLDIYHFSRYFKKHFGCAPSKFAERNKT